MSLVTAAKRRSGQKVHRPTWPRPIRVAGPGVEPTTVALHVAAERQRIAGALHDDVSSLLFAITTGVQRAEILHSDDVDELRRTISRLGEQALEASDRLRAVLRSVAPAEPTEGVPAAAQRDLDDLAERSVISTHLVVRGVVRALPADVEHAGLNCLRQALFNIERHARADTVIVTLSYSSEEFVLVVQDDGRGLPTGYEPRAVPEAGHHWGFVSMARQVEQRGGELELTSVEEGGTRLWVRLPTCP
ncbi:MAG: sensor histidine kinase [Pseudonocardia sp.]